MSDTLETLRAQIGQVSGPSEWFTVDQDRINAFADATGDHQFIHVDPEKAKHTPFGGTIAHGYLSLSLLPFLQQDISIRPEGVKMGVNYGLDKVRFLTPVPAGGRVRVHSKLVSVDEKRPGQYLMKSEVTMEVEGADKPALIAETLGLIYV
ncbi:MAG: MaoC family dehydratase [Pseudomonadota bacterium]|jgi:acyl dehydratase|nr:MaoC family dehydratase [Pseudomonadota bacterium]